MIQIFGLLFFIILICLIYLHYQGKISRNIPIIFMFFLILIIPFTYLESNKINMENYSNYDQIMNSSLDIFYTNQKSKRRQMNELKKIELINNPIQTSIYKTDIKSIAFYFSLYSNVYSSYAGLWIIIDNNWNNILYNNTPISIVTYLSENDLNENSKKDVNTSIVNPMISRKKNFTDLDELKSIIDNIPPSSYIIILTNDYSNISKSNDNTKSILINKYKFSNSIKNNNSGSLFVMLSKPSDDLYININEKNISTDDWLSGSFNLTIEPLRIETTGQKFSLVPTNDVLVSVTNNPLINSKMNIISPATANTDYAISFTAENNESFVYLSSRKLSNEIVLYAKSPKNNVGPTSTTYLDTQRPQLWSFEPVTDINSSPLVVFIRTYSKPYFYLDAEFENGVIVLKAKRFKAGLRQHWEIIKLGSTGTEYKIRHLKSAMYLAYSDYNGYLYKDDGSVFLTKSDRYTWNINSLNDKQVNKNVIEGFETNKLNSFQGMEVPTDYGSVANPSWKISRNIDGKDIIIESSGRTLWEPNYGKIWSGKWIYYGTIQSYKASLDVNSVKFLNIQMDQNGNGQVVDEYLNYKMNVINAGSNILTGLIPSGQYKGDRAIFKIIPTDLKYSDPSKSYPVKMRYFIENGNRKLNLSSGNIYNMNGYSTKFEGDKLILANFLEASGIQTDPNLAFSPGNLQKINANIKEQITISPNIRLANKYMTSPIKTSRLLYKASRDSWSPTIFHQLSDNKGPTITIATLQDGRIIGAYSPISWETMNNSYINNMEAFLFDNDKKYTTAESLWGISNYAIYQSNTFGPTFGGGHDFQSLASWQPQVLTNNAFTYINNGKGPLGVNRLTYNNYQLKDLEVYNVDT